MSSTVLHFIRRFVSVNTNQEFAMVIKPGNIISVASSEEGRKKELIWHFKNGLLKKAWTVKVLNDTYIIVEEKRLFRSRATLININEVASVSIVTQ
jgi:hypothetical protein